MNFKEMSAEDLIARQAEIRSLVDAEDADLDALETEARGIREELETRQNEASRKEEIRKMVAEGKAPETKEIEKYEEERKVADVKEIRSSNEYAQAYLNMMKNE